MNVTITQIQGFYTVWIGKYPYMVFINKERALKRIEKIKQILAK